MFRVNWPFGSGVEAQKKIQYGHHGGHLRVLILTILANFGHLGFTIEKNLAFFELQVTPTCPTKFRVYWPFGSGEEAQNIFSDFQSERF